MDCLLSFVLFARSDGKRPLFAYFTVPISFRTSSLNLPLSAFALYFRWITTSWIVLKSKLFVSFGISRRQVETTPVAVFCRV
jgi:hypothetical protein